MWRSIKTLHNFEPPATTDEAHAAALQYVRKISGAAKPPKNREVEAEKARARAAVRYAT